jgi:hypothetical protein
LACSGTFGCKEKLSVRLLFQEGTGIARDVHIGCAIRSLEIVSQDTKVEWQRSLTIGLVTRWSLNFDN